jgi:hypothetical protein
MSDTDKKEHKPRKTKALKEGPKKNQSSYLHFCAEEREKIKSEGNNVSNKDMLAEMGKRWKKLAETDPERLKRHEEEARLDKERYLSEKSKKETVEPTAESVETTEAVEDEAQVEEEAPVEEAPVAKKRVSKKKTDETVQVSSESKKIVRKKKVNA